MINLEEHLGLVGMIAKKFSKYDYEDMFQEGCIGLLRAKENFDTSKGYEFSTFATVWIRGQILNYIRDKYSIVRTPYKAFQNYGKIKNVYNEDENIFEMPVDEISKRTGLSEEDIKEALICNYPTKSLDEESWDKKDLSQYNEVDVILKCGLEEAFKILNEKEKYVIVGLLINGFSQGELSKTCDMSQVQISRTQARALKKIKDKLGVA